MQNNDKNLGWLEQMAAAEAEIECYGLLAGGPGSPDDYPPMEPVLEDEETLRKFLADKFRQMREKVDARKKAFQEKQFV